MCLSGYVRVCTDTANIQGMKKITTERDDDKIAETDKPLSRMAVFQCESHKEGLGLEHG